MSESKMKLGSLFSGIGGFEYIAKMYDIEPVWASEVEPSCIRITSKHFPNMKHLGDITKINGAEIEPVDILTGGSPCFPAGTMILTTKGYIPIEDIKVGDVVLTHTGNWKSVTAVGNREAETYILKGNVTIETTANHPIYSADIKYDYPRKPDGHRTARKSLVNIGEWTHAENMDHKQWATPMSISDALTVPIPVSNNINQNPFPEICTEFWYFVGRWLGDGWVRDGYRKDKPNGKGYGTILLCDSKDKESELISTIQPICNKYSIERDHTVVKIQFTSQLLCNWLVEHFGKGAINKRIPGFVYSLPTEERVALLNGILDSDGYRLAENRYKISSISKPLVLGIRLLAESLGYSTSVSHTKRPSTYKIEGRIVNQHDSYAIMITKNNNRRTGIAYEHHKWYLCRSVAPTHSVKTVYNISVADDESYIADSIVVHNCQDLSLAGKQTGIKLKCDNCGASIDADTGVDVCPECGADLALTRSGLFMEQIRIIKEMREFTNGTYPKVALWENVCFAAGTLVTCETGYKCIEDVIVGDRVKTLSGKYYPVVKTHKTPNQSVMRLKVSGAEDLIVTENHPFYARCKVYTNPDKKQGKTIEPPMWTRAKDLTENHLIGYRLDEPTLPDNFISDAEAWAIGRWLADGSVDLNRSNPRIFISVGNAKVEHVRSQLNQLPYDIHENSPHESATNFVFTSSEFYSLIADAKMGAGNKRVPSYIFSLPHQLQKSVLDGYMSGDGYTRKRGNSVELTASTASRELAYGIARLIRNVHHVAVNINKNYPKNGMIGAREIHANHPSYVLTGCLTNKVSTSVFENGILWQPVICIEHEKYCEHVYNLSVLEDNTYEVNGIISHNCGAFSSNNGNDFELVLKEFCGLLEETLPTLRPEAWSNAGEILGESGSIAWRVLDAQYWGVPQRRRRIFLVLDFGGQRASEILFKQESLRRYPTSSRAPWKSFTAKAKSSIRTADSKCTTARVDKVTNTSVPFYDTKCDNTTEIINGDTTVTAEPIVFEPGAASRLGGHVWEDGKSGTLRADMGDNQPAVVVEESTVYGLCSVTSNSMKSDNPDSGFYEASISKTLDTNGLNPTCNQGGNVVVTEPVYCLQGNGIDRSDTAGCNGKGWKEDVCYTLNTVDRPAVAYGVHENQRAGESTVAAFLGEQGEKARSIAYSEKVSPTLKTGTPPTVMHPVDADRPYVAAFAHQTGSALPHLPYDEELSPTLNCHQTMAVLIDSTPDKDITLIDTHSQDCRWSEVKSKVVPTLTAAMGMGGNNTPFIVETDRVTLIENHPADSRVTISEDGVCQTLSARMGTGGGNVPMVLLESDTTVYGGSGFADYREGSVGTLKASGGDLGGGSESLLVHDYTMTDGEFTTICEDQASTLKARDCKGAQVLVHLQESNDETTPMLASGKSVVGTLQADPLAKQLSGNQEIFSGDWRIISNSIVRRLTPLECERLQGFPDGWTASESDANRYKALGNSVALPCVDYIMRGIKEALEDRASSI